MIPFTIVSGPAVSLPDADIDTDIIYPARFLLITEKRGLGRYAFHDRRADPGFPIKGDTAPPILIAGENFGCGSSREQAPWAIGDLGIRVIIAPSFGEIFFGNCFRNGLLPIRLAPPLVADLHAVATCGHPISVDLVARQIHVHGRSPIAFDVADDRRESLINGWNETTRLLALHSQDIAQFEAAQRRGAPWLWKKDVNR